MIEICGPRPRRLRLGPVRGRMTGDDWQIPALQQRYRGYFTPHIERLIRAAS